MRKLTDIAVGACLVLLVLWNAYLSFLALMFVLVNPTPWNFPGDPPLFEFLLYLAGAILIITGPAWLLLGWRASTRNAARASLTLVRVISLCWLAISVVSVVGIAERHGPRWRNLRVAIRVYGNAMAADAGDRRQLLSEVEFEEFRAKYIPHPVPVFLPGRGTVHLRMTRSAYPYVGVDFGAGANALFDPRTMFCTYSD